MITKSFEQWLAEEVEIAFDLERIKAEESKLLQHWVSHINLPTKLSANVKRLQKLLKENVDNWNEDELKMMFLGPLLVESDFNHYPHYKVFSHRKAILKTEKVEASGKIQWMVAQGKQIHRTLFFFLYECKNEKLLGNDPLGQLLIAMVYAKEENKNALPIYGTYILGRFWFFVILKDKEYAVSPAFDATKTEDLAALLANMQKVKEAIHSYLNI